jgi:hypothetical protein
MLIMVKIYYGMVWLLKVVSMVIHSLKMVLKYSIIKSHFTLIYLSLEHLLTKRNQYLLELISNGIRMILKDLENILILLADTEMLMEIELCTLKLR